MKLKDYDWDLQLEVEVEYPDHIIQKFINYLRLNKQWRESPEIVYNRFLVLQRDLTDARNDAALEAAKQGIRCSATTKSGEQCKRTTGIRDGLCVVHQRHSLVLAAGSVA